MTKTVDLPKHDELFRATLQALTTLGGSGTISEIEDELVANLGITQEQLDVTYPKSGAPVLTDRMSWARSFLKYPGFLANPTRGVWVLTEEGRAVVDKSNAQLKKLIDEGYKALMAAKAAEEVDEPPQQTGETPNSHWSDDLLNRLLVLDPSAFERLCQRLLRESGFIKVEVTGKSGDGGIDGVGVLRMNLISFQVLFQCKRWKGSVGSETVRNFRGAMQGRADKGLIITTGSFTSEARKEATRDGAPAIDLIDGEALCDLLKERGLGVQVRQVMVEEVSLDEAFFDGV